ncbi:MAG: tRNA-(ms[2]io[6]A)-hydroxylase [Deltaproteobacteria bacterium]|nr:tRNA-(ms[2]io[6]A)-hydroxylase [Deltaproteobacteria bacterium]
MLGLKSDSDEKWLSMCLENLDAVLVDHALCEQKAAITALSLVSRYPDDPYLVEKMSELAQEESEHLTRVSSLCHRRGLTLEHPQKDRYVKALRKLSRDGEVDFRVDLLLICSLIEARSCERIKLIGENTADEEVKELYEELWRTEAGHHTLFVELAERTLVRKTNASDDAARKDVRARLEELCEQEATIVANFPPRATLH